MRRRKKMHGLVKWGFVALHVLLVIFCVGAFVEASLDGSRKWTDWLAVAFAAVVLYYTYDRTRFGLKV